MSTRSDIDEHISHARAIVRAALDGLDQGDSTDRLIGLMNALTQHVDAISESGVNGSPFPAVHN